MHNAIIIYPERLKEEAYIWLDLIGRTVACLGFGYYLITNFT